MYYRGAHELLHVDGRPLRNGPGRDQNNFALKGEKKLKIV